ncbi:hypothetical protein SARC_01735, partial [Sphaeroforma arctica JP610]
SNRKFDAFLRQYCRVGCLVGVYGGFYSGIVYFADKTLKQLPYQDAFWRVLARLASTHDWSFMDTNATTEARLVHTENNYGTFHTHMPELNDICHTINLHGHARTA